MNGWDDVLKARARREDCPLPQGFEEQIQKELDWLPKKEARFDVDALVLYDPQSDLARLCRDVDSLRRQGLSVRVEKSAPPDLRYCYLYRFDGRLSLEEDRGNETAGGFAGGRREEEIGC